MPWTPPPGGLAQGSPPWFSRRALWPSGSTIHPIISTAAGYKRELARRLSPPPPFSNAAMEHGTMMEPVSRVLYEEARTATLRVYPADGYECPDACAFVSPDGWIVRAYDGAVALLEIKNTVTRDPRGPVPLNYQSQMQLCMAALGVDIEILYTTQLQAFDAPDEEFQASTGRKGVLYRCGAVVCFVEGEDPASFAHPEVRCWWVLHAESVRQFKRDPGWLPAHLPTLRRWKADLDAASL